MAKQKQANSKRRMEIKPTYSAEEVKLNYPERNFHLPFRRVELLKHILWVSMIEGLIEEKRENKDMDAAVSTNMNPQ